MNPKDRNLRANFRRQEREEQDRYEERRHSGSRNPARTPAVGEEGEEQVPGGPLGPFFLDELIVGQPVVVKSGKEATVYCCQAHPALGTPWLAAKVFRARERRNFKNDAVYQQGRTTRDTRLDRAIRNKTGKGREVQFATWIGHEYGTLSVLHAAGADVPRPIATAERALLMEYFGERGAAAPQLMHVNLRPQEARPLFEQLLRNLAICLDCDRVHADLSPYNILYWQGQLQIIDFPQAVDPMDNPAAFGLFVRDVANVCDYFAQYNIRPDPQRLALRLWLESGRARP